jgi:hypothetical protein
VLFTVQSPYWFTIGRRGVLRLGGWSPHVQSGFHEPEPTRGHSLTTPLQDCHLLWSDFPDGSRRVSTIRFRSALLTESRLLSFPPVTEMFQFTGFALPTLCIQVGVTLAGRVSPFGHSRIKARLLAPRDFSQATTSFIACDRQGIHHMHLFA